MKKILLFTLLYTGFTAGAQTTHMVNWGVSEPAAQFSRTIDSGDTVMWTWTSPHPHNVTSNNGSVETFASATQTGVGLTYSKVFTVVGANSYRCTIHSGMTGTITVQAVGSTQDNTAAEFKYFPNPVVNELTISAPQVIDRVQVFDMNGKAVLDVPGLNPNCIIYMSNYNAGTYLVKVTAGKTVKSFSVMKK
jgi:plastocyanin